MHLVRSHDDQDFLRPANVTLAEQPDGTGLSEVLTEELDVATGGTLGFSRREEPGGGSAARPARRSRRQGRKEEEQEEEIPGGRE